MAGEWIQKAWGRTRTLFADAQVEIVECEIKEGGYSSEHMHVSKHNQFFVVSGCLDLVITDTEGGPGKIRLNAGGTWTVPAGTAHSFHAGFDTRLIESYVATEGEIDPLDIVRFSEGGLRE